MIEKTNSLDDLFIAQKVLTERLRDPIADSVHLTPMIQLQVLRSDPYQYKGSGSRGVEYIYISI